MLTGGLTKGSRQQWMALGTQGIYFLAVLWLCGPLRAGRCGADAGGKDPGPESRPVGRAGFQYVVSEANSEKPDMLPLNDSPKKSPQQYSSLGKAKQKQRPIRGDPSVLFLSTLGLPSPHCTSHNLL